MLSTTTTLSYPCATLASRALLLDELLRIPAPRDFLAQTLMFLRSVSQRQAPSATGPDPDSGLDPNSSLDPSAAASAPPEATMSMEELVEQHADAVYRVALSVTRDPVLAEDASQDTLIKAWQALPTYRGEAPLRHWILRIAHNVSISMLRKRREEVMSPMDFPEQTAAGPGVESQVQDRLAIERFEAA